MDKQNIILAVEASTSCWSFSLLFGNKQIGFGNGDKQTPLSTFLLPKISSVLEKTGKKISDIDLFAVSIGPGSFTGLRVANSVIQGFAKAAGKRIIGVSYFEVLANSYVFEGNICVFTVFPAGKIGWQNFECYEGIVEFSNEIQIENLGNFFQRQPQSELLTDIETFKKLDSNLIGKHLIRSVTEINLAGILGQLAALKRAEDVFSNPNPLYFSF